MWRIEVKDRSGTPDSGGSNVRADIADLKITSIREVRVVSVYLLEGDVSRAQADVICRELLIDPVVQQYQIFGIFGDTHRDPNHPFNLHNLGHGVCPQKSPSKDHHIVEIAYNPGVMDPVEGSVMKGIRDLGIDAVEAVRTARQYHLYGALSNRQIAAITNRVLMNKLIQHVVTRTPPNSLFKKKRGDGSSLKNVDSPPLYYKEGVGGSFKLIQVDLIGAGDKALMDISQKGQLYLNINEMRAIRSYFQKQRRNPTDIELETIAQTWSEHCRHKTFRGTIRYSAREGGRAKTKMIRNLFKTTIAKATHELNKPWCVSVFHDNAGVIAFDDQYHVCFKVETHNHPSALEPFGGANTGMGGVIRDTLGTGLGAKPLCNTDVFCFAPPDTPYQDLPQGALHPKRVMKGVVAGVRDYGNKMGIPTVNGTVLFDARFAGNPLVFCGNVGLIPKGKEHKKVHKGDLIVTVGGRTGRDGIHGATFSSGELTGASETVSCGAVQIGNPIEEKKVLDALLKARDLGLYCAITDCGAGGFSSAVGEMGTDTGARVDLDKAPLKYQGLKYHEIWISESQERMVMAVPPKNVDRLLKVFADENVEAAVIGEFDGGRLQLFYHGAQVGDLDMGFIHEGIPKIIKEAVYKPASLSREHLPSRKNDLTKDLCAALNHYNVASKESIIRVYDHEVQGTSVVKPLVGIAADGPSDAAVLRPRLGRHKGIAVANGINIRYGLIDPYWMAASCVDEAIRQVIAVGGNLDRIALLDNFCWGNPDKPDRLGSLVRCAEGCYAAARAFGTPFISGKDSLYNEYTQNGKTLAIPGTILISSLGILEDVRQAVTMDFKGAGNSIYIIGTTQDELGGSIYLDNSGQTGNSVPKVNFKAAVKTYHAFSRAIAAGLVKSAHDCSEGGLGVALAEMAFAGALGAAVLLNKAPYQGNLRRDEAVLFSESNSRLIAEIAPQDEPGFKRLMKGITYAKIGTVESSPEFMVYGLNDAPVINVRIDELKAVWQEPLRSL
ncbi:MAG: phosphoribosylformylglycinamidine synthase subunit PurL [Candidatus Omnitrophica bacterium]|nr:phosphoribosylformylglycinamidine synthase subunit PurL [Candidatus Omnitrophota bacterium]